MNKKKINNKIQVKSKNNNNNKGKIKKQMRCYWVTLNKIKALLVKTIYLLLC